MQKKGKKRLKRLLIAIPVVLVVYCAVMMTGVTLIMRDQFDRGEYDDPRFTARYRYADLAEGHPREAVTFASGSNTLHGYVYGADNDRGLIVFCHGIGTGHEAYISGILWFADHGWQVLAYDETGSCESEGSGTTGLVQSALDLDSALTFVEQEERFAGMQVFVFGHSWGGYAAAAGLSFGHDVTASVSVSGYAVPMEMLDAGAVGVVGSVPAAMAHPFTWLYNKLTFGKHAGLTALDGINGSGVPVLIIHGDADQTVSYDKLSIMSHRGQITNPGCKYWTITGTYAGHNDIFRSEAANVYVDALTEELEAMEESYNGDVPEDMLEAWYAAVDKERCNEINEELFARAEAFYLAHIG